MVCNFKNKLKKKSQPDQNGPNYLLTDNLSLAQM